MNRAKFLEDFQELLQKEEPCQLTDNIEDYEEWDSLSKISTLAYFDKNLGIKLSLTKLEEVKTIEDLILLSEGNFD